MFTPQNSVFFCAYTVYQSTAEKWRKQLIELAANLHAHDDNAPIPTQPGFCFEGGINTYNEPFRAEKAILGFSLSQYPSLYFAFITQALNFDNGSMLLKPPHVPSGSRVARSNAFTNNDLPAEEFCMYDDSFRNDGNFKHYNFRFYVPSVAYTLGWPDLSFVMHNQRESRFSGHIFDSAEQALGLWDALTRSIRLRPGAV